MPQATGALYFISAACVVTSLRDGMNLVSYEYAQPLALALPLPLTLTLTLTPTLTSTLTPTLTRYVACQGESKGVLVLSEFAGAAQALGAGCVRVNPYNTEELARGMHTALSMEHEQRGNAQ